MKKVVPALLLGLSMCLTPVAHAAPVEMTGDVSVKYERDRSAGNPDVSGTMTTFKLNINKELADGWSFYARLGAQHATNPALADYLADGQVYQEDKKTVAAIDLFGFTYKRDEMLYKFGRQDVTIGSTAILYSRSDSNIGKHNFVDGISAVGKSGLVDISAVLAREDNAEQANKLYALRAGYSPSEAFSYGATFARYQNEDSGETSNHYALDGAYKFGKSSLSAEFAKSNSSADNKAYAASWNYDFDGKTAAYITNFRVETNADMGKQSDFDNDNRGFYYGLTHKITEADTVEVVYKQQEVISSGDRNDKLELTLSHSF